MTFTRNNHLYYTINNQKFEDRRNCYEKFNVYVGKIDLDLYKKSNWLLEQYKTADELYQKFGNDLIIMYSGGTDSEIVLRSFKNIGITPTAVFIKFKNDYNIEDYKVALSVANELDIKLKIFEFDVKEFYLSGKSAELSRALQCSQIAYLTVYNAILHFRQPAIMGGELLLKRHVCPDYSKWYYCFRENEDASAMRFSKKYEIPLINEWFSYTPEMIGYYLNNHEIQKLINEKYNYKLSSVSSKNSILQNLFPNIVPKIKTHGYEKLLGFNKEVFQHLSLNFPKRLEPSLDGIFIDDLMIMLFGENYASYKT